MERTQYPTRTLRGNKNEILWIFFVAIFYYYYVLLPFVDVFLGLFFFLREAFWLCGLWFLFFPLIRGNMKHVYSDCNNSGSA